MRLHVPHLGSLHFVTVVAFEGVDENLAFVKCCFKFFGSYAIYSKHQHWLQIKQPLRETMQTKGKRM